MNNSVSTSATTAAEEAKTSAENVNHDDLHTLSRKSFSEIKELLEESIAAKAEKSIHPIVSTPCWWPIVDALDRVFLRSSKSFDGMQLFITISVWFVATCSVHLIYELIGTDGAHLQRGTVYPTARSLLPTHSPVDDHYAGEAASPSLLLREHDVVLLLFYAPWSGHSRHALRHLDIVARAVDTRQVRIAAVDCWQPRGECRQAYKMYTFPVLMGYVRHVDYSIGYHGRHDAQDMLKFLHGLLHPYEHITTRAQLTAFVDSADTTIVTHVNMSSSRGALAVGMFYGMALLAAQSDATTYRVRYGLITDKALANVPNVHHGWLLKRYAGTAQTHYRQMVFHAAASAQSKEVHSMSAWSLNRQYASNDELWIDWLNAGNGETDKSEHLYEHLSTANSTLILFTPRSSSPAGDIDNEAVANFRRLAYEMRACGARREMRLAVSTRLAESRVDVSSTVAKLETCCTRWSYVKAQMSACCHAVLDVPIDGRSFTFSSAAARNVCLSDSCRSSSDSLGGNSKHACRAHRFPAMTMPPVCTPFWTLMSEATRACCHGHSVEVRHAWSVMHAARVQTAYKALPADCRSIAQSPTHCAHLNIGATASEEIDDDTETTSAEEFAVAMCASNRSVNHLMADSRQYAALARQMGMTETTHRSTLVVLVDAYYEEVYVTEDTAIDALRDFLVEHTRFALPKVVRSDSTDDADMGREADEDGDDALYPSIDAPLANLEYTIGIRRINAYTFQHEIYERPTMNVLLVHTGGRWCAACYTIMHTLHTLRASLDRLLPHGVSDLDMVQVDASSNDLPWHETVDAYPTLVFYPAHRQRTDSAHYPDTLPVTTPNVFAFVLAHAGARLRWRVALALCHDRCMRSTVRAAKLEQTRMTSALRTARSGMFDARHGDVHRRRHAHVRRQHGVLGHFVRVMHGLAVARAHVDKGDTAVTRYLHEFDDAVRQSTFLQWLLGQSMPA